MLAEFPVKTHDDIDADELESEIAPPERCAVLP
jgi:hypothetical protein